MFGGREACGVEPLGADEYLLELFRGPTASFKDLSCRLLAQLLQHAARATDDSSRYHQLRMLHGIMSSERCFHVFCQ